MIMARSQGACIDDLPGSSVRPLHLNELLEPDLGEDGGQVVLPVFQGRLLAYTRTETCDA